MPNLSRRRLVITAAALPALAVPAAARASACTLRPDGCCVGAARSGASTSSSPALTGFIF
jgi:hypothetical protein